MITNDQQLKIAEKRLSLFQSILDAIIDTYPDIHPIKYSLLVEGPLEEIEKIKAEIEEYQKSLL